MDGFQNDYGKIEPKMARRECGGWLATAPRWSPFRIGVTAPTEAEAREAFSRAVVRWGEILAAA